VCIFDPHRTVVMGLPDIIHHLGNVLYQEKSTMPSETPCYASHVRVIPIAPIVVICSKSKLHFVFQAFAGGPFSQQCVTNSDCDERLSVHAER
jgi:hypothetical protein